MKTESSSGRSQPAVRPSDSVRADAVWVSETELVLPTYMPAPPDKNPMFLEKRVYQGSSGRIYPLPFTDRIAEEPVNRAWKAIWIENEFIRALILPEIGGRIHAIQDKTNGYDLIYNQHIIKPALVGLAGPWISGGIEFNWPQHHRPATFLPVDTFIESHPDGSKTVWCSDHDPMVRMKGMHGICLHPGRAVLELKVRAYNRTPFVQTFLWWANVATRVHEGYQSFFPPDVRYVADHARRSISRYPLADGVYYGIDYRKRGEAGVPLSEIPCNFVPPHCVPASQTNGEHACDGLQYRPNDLSWYANIPTPCSYMCVGSNEDFFGGYDHFAKAGLIHVANHHISPGKKQWTWGNHDFGYAWDRNLTTPDAKGEHGPYIELMAGVYTDNQPDFSFLQPGETKSWSQFWYPIQEIGPAHKANVDAAVSFRLAGAVRPPSRVRIGVAVTRPFKSAQVIVFNHSRALFTCDCDLTPGHPFVEEIELPADLAITDLTLRIADTDGHEIIAYAPAPEPAEKEPLPATEPLEPEKVASADELFVTGLHLEQYRHATRCPTRYWREALRRDPLDARCNNAMGLWHLRRGEFAPAETHLRAAIARLTSRNANPYDGEAFYNLGICLRYQALALENPARKRDMNGNGAAAGVGRGVADLLREAYAAFYKATWNHAWTAAAYHAIAELDCRAAQWQTALDHLNRSLGVNGENTRARDLKVVVLRKLQRVAEADAVLRGTLSLDPLDWWARHLAGDSAQPDLQVCLDIAHDHARAGLYSDAIEVLKAAAGTPRDLPDQNLGALPLVQYTLGWLSGQAGDTEAALAGYRDAARASSDYCFPSRLEELLILEAAVRANPSDARAPYYLGNWHYDRRRHADAIACWEQSARLASGFSIVWRNLGIGYFNVSKKPSKALAAYEKALAAEPSSARILYERDQLWKRVGKSPAARLRELCKHRALVSQRDDLAIEFCDLLNHTGQSEDALLLIRSRRFQPWEGGEGSVLGQHVRSHLLLGRHALAGDDAGAAEDHFREALEASENLGEARHILANQSDVHLYLGDALRAQGDVAAARRSWLAAAEFKGDFQVMSVRTFSEMTYYSALAWERLGKRAKAQALLRDLLAYALKLERAEAKIDYFATSLPAMLLFEDDLQYRQKTTALFLQAQAWLGLGNPARARKLLAEVLKRDPNHAAASDLVLKGKRESKGRA